MRMTNTKKGKMYVHPATIELLTDATWRFGHRILWSEHSFTKSETELCKIYIREYYEAIPAEQFSETASTHFTSFCERIVLAKNYVSRSPYRYIPHPSVWFNHRYAKGFAGTKAWYEKLHMERYYRMTVNEIDLNDMTGFSFRVSF